MNKPMGNILQKMKEEKKQEIPQKSKILWKSIYKKNIQKFGKKLSIDSKKEQPDIKNALENQLLNLIHHKTTEIPKLSSSPSGSSPDNKQPISSFSQQLDGIQSDRKSFAIYEQPTGNIFQDVIGFTQSKYIMVFKYIQFQSSEIFTVVHQSHIYYVVEGVLRSISNEYFQKIMKNQLSSWKTYYGRVNNQINRKSDDRLSAFSIGKINNDLAVGKSYNIPYIVYQLLQPPQNTMSQIRKMIFQNKFCLLRKFLHEPYANELDKLLVVRLKNLYVQQCLLDKNLKSNLKKNFIENIAEIDLWYSESESEKQENVNFDTSFNGNLIKQNTQTLDKKSDQIQKKDSQNGSVGVTSIEKQQIMQLSVLKKMLNKTREKKEKQRMEQAEMVKLDENLKVIIFQDDTEKELVKFKEEKQTEEKAQKKEPEGKLQAQMQKLKSQKSPPTQHVGEQSQQQKVKNPSISLVENPEDKLQKITKFRLTHYFGYAQYLKRDGLFDYFEPELISKVQENQSIKLQFELKQIQKKLDKKKSKEQELFKKLQEKFMSKLSISPNKIPKKNDEQNYTFKKNDQGVILATPIKLNNPLNNILTMAVPAFKFKKKVLTNEIKMNFQDNDERELNDRYASPTKSFMSYEPDLSSSIKSEKDSSLPIKSIRKKYLGEISQNFKEEEFKKQIMKLKPIVEENMRRLSIKLEAQFTLEQIAEAFSEESGDELQIYKSSSFKKIVEKLKQPVRTKTNFNFDRRMSTMVPQDQENKLLSQLKRNSISPNMKFPEISKDSIQMRSTVTNFEITEGVTFRQQFENIKQQKEADISEFSIDMDKKKKVSENTSKKKDLLFMSHETIEISSTANLPLLDHIYDIESECDIQERPIMFRDLKHNPQFHQQKLLEQQEKLKQIQALLQSIISDYQCDIIREKYFRNKLIKLRKRRTQKQNLEKQMKQKASNDLRQQIRRMSIVQNIDKNIQNIFIKTYKGEAYLMEKKSIFSPVISKRIIHQNKVIPFDFQRISKAIYTFNQINQLSENELNELQIESDSSSQDVEQDFQESFSASPSPNLQNENFSSSFKSMVIRSGSASALVSPSINSKMTLQDLKDDCIEKFSNLSQDSVDSVMDFKEYKEINMQLEATVQVLKKMQNQRTLKKRSNINQNNQSEESSEEQKENEEEKNAKKNQLFNDMIAETKSLDFIRAFETQKKIQKERQEKFQRIQEIQKRQRPIDYKLASSARQKFQRIMLDIVRSNKSLEVVELLHGLTKKAQQQRSIGTMKPQEMNKLRLAIENNNEQIIADFVQFNSQLIDNQAEDGCTLLCLAVRYARVGIVEMLLKEGADANIPCKDGMNTPLHFAVSQNQKKITNLLINYGADEKIKNYNGLTPWEGI